ncbi:MAG TPA: hypothetical protein V6C78_23775 [Crinalium sp.]
MTLPNIHVNLGRIAHCFWYIRRMQIQKTLSPDRRMSAPNISQKLY